MESSSLILICNASPTSLTGGWLQDAGFAVLAVRGGREAVDALKRRPPLLVIAEVDSLVAEGLPLLLTLQAARPQVEIVLVAPPSPAEAAVAAMKAGASDVLFAPLSREAVVQTAHEIVGRYQSSASERRQWKDLRQRFAFEAMVAHSSQMLQLLTLAARVAPTDATVLITGESGTGKELMARAIHANSSRARQPMLSINCAAIPESLLESELFGHRRGSFTGAHADKPGLLAGADGGTLFLDEVADLALATQAKLLRFLQEGTYFPVGSASPHSADVRVIAATNADLSTSVRSGAFRHDLFYRLSVFPLHIAPLRERREDIIPLARTFVQRSSERISRKPPLLSRDVIRHLLSRAWPGNVRELENAVQRAVILCDGTQLSSQDFRLLDAGSGALHASKPLELPENGVDLPELNRRLVAAALERTQFNVSAAARLLGLSRPALRYRMEKYGLRTPTLAA